MTRRLTNVERATKQYIRLQQRVEALQEQMALIKEQIATEYPEGVTTAFGTWQAYAEGVRLTYDSKGLQSIVDELVINGNSELAQKILQQRKQSHTSSGIRFIKKKGE